MNQNTHVKKSKRNTTRSSAPVRQTSSPGRQTSTGWIESVQTRPVFTYPDEPTAFPLGTSSARIPTDQTAYAQKKDIDLFTPTNNSSPALRDNRPEDDYRRQAGRSSSSSKNTARISSSYTTISDSAFTPTDENEAYAREITARRREEKHRAAEQARMAQMEQARREEELRIRAEEKRRAYAKAKRSAQIEAERKARDEAERSAYAEAEKRARIEPKRRAQADAERRERLDAERSARTNQERKRKNPASASQHDSESSQKKQPNSSRVVKRDSAPKQTAAEITDRIPSYLKEPQTPQAYHEIPAPVPRKKKRKKQAQEAQLSDYQPLLDYSEESKTIKTPVSSAGTLSNSVTPAAQVVSKASTTGVTKPPAGTIRIPAQVQTPTEVLTDLQDVIPVKEGTGDIRPHAIKKERESRRKRDERLTYLLVIFVIIFAVSAFFLFRIFWRYKKASSEYAALEKDYVEIPDGADLPVNKDDPTYAKTPYPNLKINFPSLYAINNDLIGWIYVPGCGISYPLVKGTDNEYYLSHTFEKNASDNGAIFMDDQDKSDFSSFNTFIYGHDMKDGSMFASLFKYGTNADLITSYPYFFIYLINGNVLKYQVCSFYTSDGNSDSYLRVDTSEQKASYVAMILAKSTMIKSESTAGSHLATADDTFVTLSTCHGTSQRFLVHGYLTAIYNTITGSVNELY